MSAGGDWAFPPIGLESQVLEPQLEGRQVWQQFWDGIAEAKEGAGLCLKESQKHLDPCSCIDSLSRLSTEREIKPLFKKLV